MVKAQQILDKLRPVAYSDTLPVICCCITQKQTTSLKTGMNRYLWGSGGGWFLVSPGHCGSPL